MQINLIFSTILISMVSSLVALQRHSVKNIATRFILMQTQHKGNVGAAARALKTMGFDDLRLVSPRDLKVLNRQRTKEAASGAVNVLENARILSTLEEATEGCNHVCATGMPHSMSVARPQYSFEAPREYFQNLLENRNDNDDDELTIALVFGNERVGMSEEDIEKCDIVLGIPTNPDFGSLNLASAVQLIAYDWRQALGGFPLS